MATLNQSTLPLNQFDNQRLTSPGEEAVCWLSANSHLLVLLLHNLAQGLHVERHKHEEVAQNSTCLSPLPKQHIHQVNLDAHADIHPLQIRLQKSILGFKV
jgi:hypothetical protein